ncbi:MAG TPA: potassium channel protein [Spirochaetota bacterium]|nr:potassium channel protein [Spirochaetota bacterium]HPS85729.1 potassium channel protein [Spirochaetota bacterium]
MRKLRSAFYLFLLTCTSGVLAYHFIEGMSFSDAIFMTAITISSVGFGEVQPLSGIGRIITIFIIVFGITIAGYTLGTFIRMLIEGEISERFGRKKVAKRISGLKNHFIVCGFGRIGKLITKELMKNNEKVIVLENDTKRVPELEAMHVTYMLLDASDEATLLKAGIMKAKGLVTAVMSDADNVFITLTARMLHPDIYIMARASDAKNEKKLTSAGADKVVSPYLIGGQRMAQMLIRPTVVDFIDIATMDDKLGLRMEEAKISAKSNYIGKTLVESNLRKDFGVIIVLIKKYNGEMKFNPQPTEILEMNDVIVMLGKINDVEKINAII